MNRFAIAMAFAVLALSAGKAEAADGSISSGPASVGSSSTSGWVLNGSNLGVGRNAFLAEVGWPGLNLTLLHGQSDRLDIGGTFSFTYGLEGVPDIAPGMKLNAVLRLNLADTPKYNVGLRVSPGVVTYFPTRGVYRWYFNGWHDSNVMFGLQIPVELVTGILVTSSLSINLGISMPMTLFFVPDFSFLFPVQPGFGIEYKVDSSLTITFDNRFGPSIFMVPGGSEAHFGFRSLVGIAFKF
ncbi:MAG: hypothetical protein HY901_08270 [Deltaproteobacteria bacterium]|nr:hypothetical protein [Deltaproteobacteria bacterium]